jgi:hypothetical protein
MRAELEKSVPIYSAQILEFNFKDFAYLSCISFPFIFYKSLEAQNVQRRLLYS